MASSGMKRLASEEAEGGAGSRRQRQGSPTSSGSSDNSSDDSYHANPWGSPIPKEPNYWADQYRKERDEAREELGVVTKKYGVLELEWEDLRKQLFERIDALSKENDGLKAAAKMVADKMNAHGDTEVERLQGVPKRVDEAVIHGVHLGVTLGLAAMSSRTDVDYSNKPIAFAGGSPHEVEDISDRLVRYDAHADALSSATNPQSVLNKLFRE